MSELAARECIPCKGGVPPMDRDAAAQMLAQLGAGWLLQHTDSDYLEKTYRFKNFREALDFVNRIGGLAEQVNHHPDIFLAWGRVTLSIWTHKIKGLSESDFVFAAKCDALTDIPDETEK
jgi:4a-hydroxytetrahydrobiopterin dehydratase